MKYLLLLSLLSFTSASSEYQFDAGYSQVEHAWRGHDNWATYEPKMKNIGASYIHSSGFAGRLGYGSLNETGTSGKYHDFILEMDYIISLEVMYRMHIESLTVFGGIGTYIIPASVRSKSTSFYDKDYDNDEGYFLGAEYNTYKNISLGYKFNMYSRIKVSPYDEWTKGHQLYLAYKF